jgi:Thiolase, N-terminal domain
MAWACLSVSIEMLTITCRIPFTLAGTVYKNYMAVDLARFALKGLLTKTALDPASIDYLYYGSVIQVSPWRHCLYFW